MVRASRNAFAISARLPYSDRAPSPCEVPILDPLAARRQTRPDSRGRRPRPLSERSSTMSTQVRAAAYFRMSTADQENSIERQRSQVIPYADRQGYRIV